MTQQLATSKHFEITQHTYAHRAIIHHTASGEIVGWVSPDRDLVGYVPGYLTSNQLRECRRLIRRVSIAKYADAAEKAIRYQLDEMNYESQG